MRQNERTKKKFKILFTTRFPKQRFVILMNYEYSGFLLNQQQPPCTRKIFNILRKEKIVPISSKNSVDNETFHEKIFTFELDYVVLSISMA